MRPIFSFFFTYPLEYATFRHDTVQMENTL